MKKSPKEIAALIIGKPKPAMERTDHFGQSDDEHSDGEDGEGEDLDLVAGDVLDAIKQDDEQAFSEALRTFVESVAGGR